MIKKIFTSLLIILFSMAILTGQEIKIENEPRETVSDTNKTLEQKLVDEEIIKIKNKNAHEQRKARIGMTIRTMIVPVIYTGLAVGMRESNTNQSSNPFTNPAFVGASSMACIFLANPQASSVSGFDAAGYMIVSVMGIALGAGIGGLLGLFPPVRNAFDKNDIVYYLPAAMVLTGSICLLKINW